jgi:hypothetical protein
MTLPVLGGISGWTRTMRNSQRAQRRRQAECGAVLQLVQQVVPRRLEVDRGLHRIERQRLAQAGRAVRARLRHRAGRAARPRGGEVGDAGRAQAL